MNIFKIPICIFKNHKFDQPSIVNTICKNNWIKKCSTCGMYFMNGYIGKVPISKRKAYKIKKEFEEKFPYSVQEQENDEQPKKEKRYSGYTITYIPQEDNEGKEVVLARFRCPEDETEKDKFLKGLKHSGLTDEELSTVSVYKSYYYMLKR